MNPNGTYTKNGAYFNELPVYVNSEGLFMFWGIGVSGSRWAIAASLTNDEAAWVYYANVNERYPTNSDAAWTKGSGEYFAGFVGDEVIGNMVIEDTFVVK